MIFSFSKEKERSKDHSANNTAYLGTANTVFANLNISTLAKTVMKINSIKIS